MALISKTRLSQKEKVKFELNQDVLKKMEAYCQWAGVDDMSFFVEEAALYVFNKDKEWKIEQKRHKKSQKANKEKV